MAVAMEKMTREIKRLDIWNVDLGKNEGSVQSGERPVVVVQNNVGNKFSPVIIVAPVTSRKKKKMPTHVNFSKKEVKDIDDDSTILFEQLFTVSKDQLDFKISQLPAEFIERIDNALCISLGMSSSVN
ncbi:type II toxin-antitoxin system PemK/MazF family toxin [Paenibacillus polymyxa]|uniref:type II toxin-antitoxin system PemK/MazF family toxin n=1 Tax=Paenibacillus polymyxa TaxID=1406 RepID=UPI002AB37CF3|nr:type II toxin-antitoxin system PemK/MazF family toxin [Paenibacillus polymyxa]MDY8021187.1 type II toxin-antitoxin system PemK/MazF family toxin [Paenibacillus polymyxa]